MAYKARKDIKVPESYIQKIRDTKTKSAALAKYGKSTDPKMREALRRFYGSANVVSDSIQNIPKKNITNSTLKNRPPNSVPMSKSVSDVKPKSNAQKVDSFVRGVYKKAGPENFIAGGAAIKVGKSALKLARSVNIAKNTKILKTAKGAEANLARTKSGYSKGLSTKSEVKQAKAAVRSTKAQRVSSAARTGVDTAKYYGSAAKNSTSTRTSRAMEMRSTRQTVADASKKKATSLKAAETRAKKAATAKRASKAGK